MPSRSRPTGRPIAGHSAYPTRHALPLQQASRDRTSAQYDRPMNAETLRINSARLRADFDALSEIGSTGDGGVHRPSLSEAHLAARRWLREQIENAGLEFHVDGAGNHSARLACANAAASTLLLGSHLDSVPFGGRFDGAL